MGRKVKGRLPKKSILPQDTNDKTTNQALFKKIVRRSEWENEGDEEKGGLEETKFEASAVIEQTLYYVESCIVTDTQFFNIVKLLDSLPELKLGTSSEKKTAIDMEEVKLLFEFLDNYTYDQFFRLHSISQPIDLLLKLRALLNQEFVKNATATFGGSIVGPNIEAIINSRLIKSKAVDLFCANSAKYYGFELENKESAEIADISARSSSNLRNNPSHRFLDCQAAR